MKSKLLATIALPALIGLAALPVTAQTAPPKESPSATTTTTAAPSNRAGSYTPAQTADQWRSSKVVGLNVYNARNEKIGDINDLILDGSGKIVNAVIGVGGFLGIGEKNVAVPFSDLKMTRQNDGTISVTHDSTKETLEKAPSYTYHQQTRG